ncbi:hypothetical protein CULT_250035 [[Clostridium] ultunense Esp]|uniref:Uncharacterized protein n=1 Tax=[Clostridium] ultunense Esp TaxID=1288971 RepID=M1ZKF0_9FIRM|nr:hypothetical protein [Schnuerera ultunensis]CCQ95337.1 hypothetical protein CULT_250035 [[Clostridium] ultunense Esp]SHD76268.1 conserved protein of unknown function [[Clostridium] ultunense Esp]
MTNIYSEMQEGFKQLNSRTDGIENETKKTDAKIEHQIIPKNSYENKKKPEKASFVVK